MSLSASKMFIPLQILWMSPLNTCMEATGKCRQTCLEEINNTFKGICPTPESCSWQCAVERFEKNYGKCESDRVYHCARNYTDKNLLDLSLPRGYAYIEACAKDILCGAGTYNVIHVENCTPKLKHCLININKHVARFSGTQPAISTDSNINCYQHTSGGADCRCCYLHFVWKPYKCQQPGQTFFTVLCVRRSSTSISQRIRYNMVCLKRWLR